MPMPSRHQLAPVLAVLWLLLVPASGTSLPRDPPIVSPTPPLTSPKYESTVADLQTQTAGPASIESGTAGGAPSEFGSPVASPGVAQSATFVAQDIFFEPTRATIVADMDVWVSLPNKGAAAHNFSIDELGIDVDIRPDEIQEIVINAPAGEYEIYCNVRGHREAGMVGTLIVK